MSVDILTKISSKLHEFLAGEGGRTEADINQCLLAGFTDEFLREFLNLLTDSNITDFRDLGKRLSKLIRERCGEVSNKDILLILNNIKLQIAEKVDLILDDNLRNSVALILTKVIEELAKEIKSFSERPFEAENMQFDSPMPIETGYAVDGSFDAWNRINRRAMFSGGVRPAPDTPIAYTRFLYTPYDPEWENFILSTDLAGGVFGIFQSGNKGASTTAATMASASFFAGSKLNYKMLGLRLGINSSAAVWTGYNTPIMEYVPVDIGASIGLEFSRKHSIFAGAVGESLLWLHNIQDATSAAFVFNRLVYFLSFQTPYVNADIDLFMTKLGDGISGRVYKGFDAGQFTIAPGLEAMIGFPSKDIAMPPSAFLNLTLSYGDEDTGIAVRGNLHGTNKIVRHKYTTRNAGVPSSNEIEIIESWEKAMDIKEGDSIKCSQTRGVNINCIFRDKDLFKCTPKGEGYECHMQQKQGTYPQIDVMVAPSTNDGNGHYIITGIEETYTVDVAKERLSEALKNATSYNELMTQLKDSSFEEKLTMLEAIASLLYETYNKDAVLTTGGSANSSGMDKMTEAIKVQLFGSDKDKMKVSVCRGYAGYITRLAYDWGLHAYSVEIQTKSSGHVISLVRKEDGDWYVINYGQKRFRSYERDIMTTLIDYCKSYGYPPQLLFHIYDQYNEYTSTIVTPEGQYIFDRVKAPGRLNNFLRNK